MRTWGIKSSRALALPLCLCLLLSGCGSFLERNYSAETAHSQFSDEEKNSDILRANTYQGLVSALLFLVTNGEESAVIRLYDYEGDAEADLDKACLEVSTQDPLGAYAVDYMKYDVAKVTDCTEVSLKLVYQRSWQQISSVSSVTGSSAILGELRAALLEFQKEKVLKVSYFDPSASEQSLIAMVEEAYYDVPEAAFGLPEATVQFYPKETVGQQRLVEILLDYPLPREQLRDMQTALLARTADLVEPLTQKKTTQKLTEIARILEEQVTLRAEGDGTAYAALIGGESNALGLTLAAELLLQTLDVQCRMVRGQQNGVAHSWLVVQLDDGWQHWDVSAALSQTAGDAAMQAKGYRWSGDIPQCRDLSSKLF